MMMMKARRSSTSDAAAIESSPVSPPPRRASTTRPSFSKQPSTLRIARECSLISDDSWVTDLPFEETYRALSVSYAGKDDSNRAPSMKWATAHLEDDGEDLQSKIELISYLMALSLKKTYGKKHLTLAKKVDDKIVATGVIVECDFAAEESLFKVEKLRESKRKSLLNLKMFLKGETAAIVKPPPKLEDPKSQKVVTKIESLQELLKDWHKQYGPKSKHWYVDFVAVDPELQNQGYGTELVQKVNELADAQKVDCYIETESERHKVFYERLGYETIATKTLNNVGILKIYIMIRKSGAQGSSSKCDETLHEEAEEEGGTVEESSDPEEIEKEPTQTEAPPKAAKVTF